MSELVERLRALAALCESERWTGRQIPAYLREAAGRIEAGDTALREMYAFVADHLDPDPTLAQDYLTDPAAQAVAAEVCPAPPGLRLVETLDVEGTDAL